VGLLADAFSYGDSLKRKVGGLLADPMGTIELGINRLKEDNNDTLNLFANAYPMAGNRTVLNSPAQKAAMQKQLADYASTVGMAGVTAPSKFVYPQEKALATAQRNAAKPVSEGGLGLRPDNTPMERAKAMGADTEAFHATNSDYKILKKNKVTPYGDRFFSTPDTNYVNEYAMKSGISGDTPKVTAWREKTSNGAGPNIMPLLLGEHKASSFSPIEFVSKPWGGNLGEAPQLVRSRFAAFDPARRNEADLLGRADPALLGILGGGSLLGLGAYNYGKE
jgi:hypothetical protein